MRNIFIQNFTNFPLNIATKKEEVVGFWNHYWMIMTGSFITGSSYDWIDSCQSCLLRRGQQKRSSHQKPTKEWPSPSPPLKKEGKAQIQLDCRKKSRKRTHKDSWSSVVTFITVWSFFRQRTKKQKNNPSLIYICKVTRFAAFLNFKYTLKLAQKKTFPIYGTI